MSRNISNNIRNIIPDAHYRNVIISKLTNLLMFNGKKSIAEKLLYRAIKIFFSMIDNYSISTFVNLFNFIKPVFEVKQRRIGGATYQVPVTVSSSRGLKLCIRWLVISSRSRKNELNISYKLANEFYDIYNKRGSSYKKKIEMHKIAQANKAFAHYRW